MKKTGMMAAFFTILTMTVSANFLTENPDRYLVTNTMLETKFYIDTNSVKVLANGDSPKLAADIYVDNEADADPDVVRYQDEYDYDSSGAITYRTIATSMFKADGSPEGNPIPLPSSSYAPAAYGTMPYIWANISYQKAYGNWFSPDFDTFIAEEKIRTGDMEKAEDGGE